MVEKNPELAARAKRVAVVLSEIKHELRIEGFRATQAEIAAGVNTSDSMISRWFTGTVSLREKNIPALAKFFAHGDEGREQNYIKRLHAAIADAPSADPTEMLAYAFQLLGDLGLSAEKRDAVLKDRRLAASLRNYVQDKPVIEEAGLIEPAETILKNKSLAASLANYVQDKPAIEEAGLIEFAEAIAGDPVRVSALRLALANLMRIGDPK